MLVPDPRSCDSETAGEIVYSLNEMRERTTLPLSEEFELSDRRGLDDAVLRLMGYSDTADRNALCEELYSEMARTHREIRGAEVEMQKFRRITARRDRASPHTIAEEIWEEFDKATVRPFPLPFIPTGKVTEQVSIPAGKTKVLDDLFEGGAIQINGNVIRLGSKARAGKLRLGDP